MSATAAFEINLPFMRCFAGALAGSPSAGDTYVAATLEALLEERHRAGGHGDPQSAFLRALISIWLPIAQNFAIDEPPAKGDAIIRTINSAPPRCKAAFFLRSIVRLDFASIAAVLNTTTAEVRKLIARVNARVREVSRLPPLKPRGFVAARRAITRGTSGAGRGSVDRRAKPRPVTAH